MAEHADGSIIVDTEIDAQGFKAGSAELQRAIKSLNGKIQSLGPVFQKALSGNSGAIASFEAKAAALENTISDLETKMQSLGDAKVPTDDYKWLTDEIEKAKNELSKLEEKQIKMQGTGVKTSSKAWQNLQYDIDLAKRKIADYEAEAADMRSNGTAFQMGSDTAEYAKLSSALAEAKAKLADMQAQVEAAKGSTSRLASAGNAVKSVFTKIGSVGKKALSGLVGLAKKAGNGIKNLGKKTTGCVGAINNLGKKINGLGGMLKRLALRKIMMGILTAVKDGFNNLAQYSNQTNADLSALTSGLTQLKNSFATAFSPILTVVTPALIKLINYLSVALTYIGKLFAAMTGATTFIKATAVQEDFAASLDRITEAAKKAQRQLAGFDELNVLSDSSSAGAGSTGDLDPSQMFEEVPIESSITDFIGKIKQAFKNGDYAGIGKIIGEGINSAVQKINEFISWDNVGTKITAGIKGIAEGFNSFVDTVDWAGIGDTIAKGFNTALNILHLVITEFDWEGVSAGLVTGLNGIIEGIDWGELGKTIFDGFVGALKFIRTALETFDWQELGKAVAEFVANIDWSELLGTVLDILDELFNGVLEFRNSLHDNLPPDLEAILTLVEDIAIAFAAWKISNPVLDGIGKILKLPPSVTVGVVLSITGITLEVKGIADAVRKQLDGANFGEIVGGGLLTTGGGAIFGTSLAKWITTTFTGSKIAGALATAASNLGVGSVAAAGGAIAAGIGGIVAGIPAMIVGIYDACTEGLNWLNSILIPAGSTAAGAGIGAIIGACGGPIGAGIGALIGLAVGLITDGITLIVQNWGAISDWFAEVGAAIGNFFTTTIPDAFGKAVDCLGEVWENARAAGANIIEGVFGGITEALKNIGTWIVENIWDPFIEGFKNAFGIHSPSTKMAEMGTFLVKGLLQGIKDVWHIVTNFFTEALNGIKNLIGSAWNGIKTGASKAWNGISNTVSGAWNGIKSGVSSACSKVGKTVSKAWGSIKTAASEKWNSIKSTLSGKWSDIKTKASEKWGDIKSTIGDTFKDLKEDAVTWGKDLCDNMADGISKAKDTVAEAVTGVAGKIKSLLGFSEPEDGPLSNFHTYMPDMIDLMTKGIKDNQGKAIGAVSDMASAISEEIQNGNYSMNSALSVSGVESALGGFSDKVENSFSALLDRLQAIADGVTFTTPVIATGRVVPYSVSTSGTSSDGVAGAIETSNDELGSVVIGAVANATAAIVAAIEANSGTVVNLDADSIATSTIKEINRRTRAMGRSPLTTV